jgi:DNA-binding YbaB/EbfC family protein
MFEDELPDLGALAQRARQLQGQMSSIQSDLADLRASGYGGGGLVTATVSAEGRLVALQIDPSVIDPDDPETLAQLVIAAVDSANDAMAGLRNERMTQVTDGMQSILAGLGPVGGARIVPRFPSRRPGTSPPGPASRPGAPPEDVAGR